MPTQLPVLRLLVQPGTARRQPRLRHTALGSAPLAKLRPVQETEGRAAPRPAAAQRFEVHRPLDTQQPPTQVWAMNGDRTAQRAPLRAVAIARHMDVLAGQMGRGGSGGVVGANDLVGGVPAVAGASEEVGVGRADPDLELAGPDEKVGGAHATHR